MTAKKKSQ